MALEAESITGWVEKKLPGAKKWKKCWYMLDAQDVKNPILAHFVHATMARLDRGADRLATDDRDEISLTSVKKVLYKGKGHKFSLLLNSGASIHLRTTSESNAERWVKGIKAAIKASESAAGKKASLGTQSAKLKQDGSVYGGHGANILNKPRKKKSAVPNKLSNVTGEEWGLDSIASTGSTFVGDFDIPPPPAEEPPPHTALGKTMKRMKKVKARDTLEMGKRNANKRHNTDAGPKVVKDTLLQRNPRGNTGGVRKRVSNKPRMAVRPKKTTLAKIPEIPKWTKKTDETLELIMNTIIETTSLSQVLLAELDEAAVDALVDKMYRVDVAAGDNVITQGTQGNQFYIIEKGRFNVYLVPNNDNIMDRQVAGLPQLIVQKGPGGFFGELALLYEQPSIVTVRAAREGVLWAISRQEFHEITTEVAKRQSSEKRALIKNSEIMGSLLTEKDISAIADAMEYADYKEGDVIYEANSELKMLLFVITGEIDVLDKNRKVISTMKKGECFGEIGLLEDYTTEFEFVVKTPTSRCITLDIAETEGVVGSLKDLVKQRWEDNPKLKSKQTEQAALQHANHIARQSVIRMTVGVDGPDDRMTDVSVDIGTAISSVSLDSELPGIDREWDEAPPLLENLDFSCLSPIKMLGRGNFGSVHLVKNNHAHPIVITDSAGELAPDYFALKVLSRDFIVDNGWEDMADNEKRAMAELSYHTRSPFIVRLFHSFADKKNIYLLLEVCDGGDLYHVVRRQPGAKMKEKWVQFYTACVVNGLDAMHSRDICYRDLKPENIIVANNGYVKIADFGLAKKTLRTFTVCGTPDYMAPETILSRGHDIAVDWWGVGVLIFETTTGQAPFPGRDPLDIYENILAHRYNELQIPTGAKLTARCVDIMNKLMHPKKTRRLGCMKKGADSVRNDPFFSDFDWNEFLSFKMTPPIKPRPPHYVDTGLYDPEYDLEPDDFSGWKPHVETYMDFTPVEFK